MICVLWELERENPVEKLQAKLHSERQTYEHQGALDRLNFRYRAGFGVHADVVEFRNATDALNDFSDFPWGKSYSEEIKSKKIEKSERTRVGEHTKIDPMRTFSSENI